MYACFLIHSYRIPPEAIFPNSQVENLVLQEVNWHIQGHTASRLGASLEVELVVLFFEGRGTPTRQVGSFFPNQGSDQCPLHPLLWKRGALTAGLPVKSLQLLFTFRACSVRGLLGQTGGQKMSEVCTHPLLFFIVSLQERDVFSNCRMTVRIQFFLNYSIHCYHHIIIEKATGT